jgi:hypothetical protein
MKISGLRSLSELAKGPYAIVWPSAAVLKSESTPNPNERLRSGGFAKRNGIANDAMSKSIGMRNGRSGQPLLHSSYRSWEFC